MYHFFNISPNVSHNFRVSIIILWIYENFVHIQ